MLHKPLPLRPLGNSDLMVTPIGLGCWQFSKQANLAGRFWPNLEEALIDRIVGISLEGGINWFDTAEVYGNGASEMELAHALRLAGKAPGSVIIATKWWPLMRNAGNITRTIDLRLKALDPFPIDLYQVHQPYGFSGEKAEMEAMAILVREKKIRYVGVSNFSASRMRSAWEVLQKHGIQLVSNQVSYSLLNRSIESNGVLQTARELGIAIIAYSPLAQGMVTGKFHDNPELLRKTGMRKWTPLFHRSGLEKSRPVVEMVRKIAEKYGATPSQVALNWIVCHHGDTVVAIPGSTSGSQAEENTGAMDFTLLEEDLALLDKASTPFMR